jgi:predicted nucleotide-binding protein (sugar kinase/HSP70/actin superfamily)
MNKIKVTEYTSGIERDLMSAIIMALKNNKTTEERVIQISNKYLDFANEQVVEVIVKKFRELGKMFGEVREVANKYWAKYLEDRRRIALARTRVYLRNGNIEKALLTTKGETHYV